MDETPRLYRELAEWWPLLSAPAEYAEEAEDYRRLLVEGSGGRRARSWSSVRAAVTTRRT